MKWKGTEYSNEELMARIDADVQHMLEMSRKANHNNERTGEYAKKSPTGQHRDKGKNQMSQRAKSSPQYKHKQTQNIRHSANCPNRRSALAKSPSPPSNQRRGNSPNTNRRNPQKQNPHEHYPDKEQHHSNKSDNAWEKPLSIGNDSGSKDILNLDNIMASVDSIISGLLSSLGIDKDTALILLVLLLLYHNEADITLIFAMLYLVF